MIQICKSTFQKKLKTLSEKVIQAIITLVDKLNTFFILSIARNSDFVHSIIFYKNHFFLKADYEFLVLQDALY